MPSWWDLAYPFRAPWNSGRPPDELKGLLEGGRLKVGRVLDIGCGRRPFLFEEELELGSVSLTQKDDSSILVIGNYMA